MMNSSLARSCLKASSSLLRNSAGVRLANAGAASRLLARTGLMGGVRPQAAFYHSGKPCLTTSKETIDAFITEEMIAEMEYHHERRDGNDLNLFLQHPSTPKIMGWHPDLIFESDMMDAEDSLSDDVEDEVEEVVAASNNTMSFLNRNARYGSRASKGKRPCSRQARRRKKRSIGTHRR